LLDSLVGTSTSGDGRKVYERFVDSFVASSINGGTPQLVGEVVKPPQSVEKDERNGRSSFSFASSLWQKGGRGGPVSFYPAAKRLVAIGDLHGDFQKAVKAFRVAGLIDESTNWVGGETVAVQVGDVLDRGGAEIRIFHFLEKLKRQAASQGGALHVLNGNHEIMNVAGRFRYATAEGLEEFHRWEKVLRFGEKLKCMCHKDGEKCRAGIPELSATGLEARREALKPGGHLSKHFLAHYPVALVVGSSVFVHGGLHPKHADYGIERMNSEASEWIRGESKESAVPWFLSGRNAIVWSRMYSMPQEEKCDCGMLFEALGKLPRKRGNEETRRMVVGHTIQYPMGINAVCDGSVFRVDVGASKGCADAEPEVLEIIEDREVRRLRAHVAPQILVGATEAVKKYKRSLVKG